MRLLIKMFILLCMNNAYSATVISEKYISGQFLVYNCLDQHYACVSVNDHNSCKSVRDTELKLEKRKLSCVSFEELENEKKCVQKIQDYINKDFEHPFCESNL